MAENTLDRFLRLFDEGRYGEALPLIEQVIDAAPQVSTSWLNYGATLAALGQELAAADAYLKASQLDPKRRGLFSACLSLANANAGDKLLDLFSAECEIDRSRLKLFLDADEFDRFFEREDFQALVRKYGYH